MLTELPPLSDCHIPPPRWRRVDLGILVLGEVEEGGDLDFEFSPHPLLVGGGLLLAGIYLLCGGDGCICLCLSLWFGCRWCLCGGGHASGHG